MVGRSPHLRRNCRRGVLVPLRLMRVVLRVIQRVDLARLELIAGDFGVENSLQIADGGSQAIEAE